MVYFYSRKLITHSFNTRGNEQVSSADSPMIAGAESLSRELEIERNYSLWDQRRLRPLAIVAILSFLFMLVVVGVVDWLDSSLKTEPQAVRYLDLPVLGSFPNIKELGDALGQAPDSQDKEG